MVELWLTATASTSRDSERCVENLGKNAIILKAPRAPAASVMTTLTAIPRRPLNSDEVARLGYYGVAWGAFSEVSSGQSLRG